MSEQLSLDDVPAVRSTDPHTSRLAAVRVAPRVSSQRARVLAVLVDHWQRHGGGLTDDAVAARLDIPNTSSGKRRLECQKAGLVEPADGVGVTRNGATALLWKPTAAGIAAVRGRIVDVPTGGLL